MYNSKVIYIVEEHLYSYYSIQIEIQNIKDKYSISDRDVNSWIKSKGKINRGVENMAIKNIEIEKEITNKIEWHYLIKNILKHYQENEPEKYLYIKLKYFDKSSTTKIEMKMAICRSSQVRIKLEIIFNIALYAVKENLLNI